MLILGFVSSVDVGGQGAFVTCVDCFSLCDCWCDYDTQDEE